MNGQVRARLKAIRASYWFVPSIMAVVAVLLGGVMIWIDARLGTGWIKGVSWYQQIRADGAREVLSTIAGSMITVAGVVFSITIVALSYASSQYGPRVLTNFMTDRGNTVTLGTFIATFLYGLMVLRVIRGGEEEFVPQLSVMVGLVLAVCSIAVLIYFIHHVPKTIHINHVVARIGEQLVRDTEKRFPALIGEAPREVPRTVRALVAPFATVRSTTTGYLQDLEEEKLLRLAERADVLVRLRYRPGDFVMAGRGLADVSPASEVDEQFEESLRACFTTGVKRTPEGDLMFLVSELVEIAARALSPGVNDPMTAVTCLDWLGAGGTEFARRELPAPVRTSADGTPRVIAQAADFGHFIELGFGRLRRYCAADMIAALHYLRVLGEIAASCREAGQVGILQEQAKRLAEEAGAELSGADREKVMARVSELQSLLALGPAAIHERQAAWLGGSA